MELTFDNQFSLSDYKMAVMNGYDRPLFAPITNKTKNIPGRPGAWDFGVDVGSRVESFPIVCLAQDPFERERLITAFVGQLFDRTGKPKTFKIRTNYDPEKWIECRVSAQQSVKYYRGGQADFELQLTAYNDPFKRAHASAYDPKGIIKYGEVAAGDYYKNPDSFTWMYSPHYYGCYNHSSLETSVVFTITNGSAKDASIKHQQSGKTLTLPDFANKTVVIDTNNKTIKINGQSILSGSNMKFFMLYPGSNGFEFRGEGVKGKVTSKWYHKFM